MPERSKPKRRDPRPRDSNQFAHQIMRESTGQAPKREPEEASDTAKNPHAVALRPIGGLKGGLARAAEVAAKAAKARWEKK